MKHKSLAKEEKKGREITIKRPRKRDEEIRETQTDKTDTHTKRKKGSIRRGEGREGEKRRRENNKNDVKIMDTNERIKKTESEEGNRRDKKKNLLSEVRKRSKVLI